jgi:hypothetical protein
VLHFSHQPKLADAQGRVCLTNPNARDDRIQNPAKFVVIDSVAPEESEGERYSCCSAALQLPHSRAYSTA